MEKIKAALEGILAIHDRWNEVVDPETALRDAQRAYHQAVLDHINENMVEDQVQEADPQPAAQADPAGDAAAGAADAAPQTTG